MQQKEQANIGVESGSGRGHQDSRSGDERSTTSKVGLGVLDHEFAEVGLLKMDSGTKHLFDWQFGRDGGLFENL